MVRTRVTARIDRILSDNALVTGEIERGRECLGRVG